jgi:radical SAM protein with 4Fe4S-binding SPASM domain
MDPMDLTGKAVWRGGFEASPLVVIWEVTRACDLACVHCRASAVPKRDPLELSTDEGRRLIRELRGFGHPVFVLTGGDPLLRPDLETLVAAAAEARFPVGLSPAGTPLLSHARLRRLRDVGLGSVSISLDGSCARMHDAFRRVSGSFETSLQGAGAAIALGMRLQINTTVTRHNLADLPAIAALVAGLEARRWTVFLLVPTGRATDDQQVTPAESEQVFEWLYELSLTAPFRIKTTEGPHYRRVVLQHRAATAPPGGSGGGRFVPGLNDGSGFLFISARGDIQPSGFLPLTAGNVRTMSPLEVYRNHPIFTALRDPDRLQGRCGRCEFRRLCGGSRARAYAATGDPLAEDPLCGYQPVEGGRA